MRKYLLLLISSLFMISCNKSGDSYYVRYEVEEDYFTNLGYITYISVNTDIGYQDFNVVRTFDQTFGPVDNNFTANIKVNTAPSNYYEKTVSIYVSKNEEPFTLKAFQKIKNSAVDLSYTIDF